jgi:hypothetical protein
MRSTFEGRVALSMLALVPASGCPTTSASREHVSADDCRACHASEYKPATLVAAHTARPDQALCGDCHDVTSWIPALTGGHPEDVFPLAAPHALACLDCHDLANGSATTTGTDCVGCHEGAHAEPLAATRHRNVPQYLFAKGQPDFCLACHRDGRKEAQRHPDERFPITSGKHRYACIDCHDRALGDDFTRGANVNCVGCHDAAHTEAVAAVRHKNVPEYIYDAANPAFCRACHPDGVSKVAHPEARFPITDGPHRYTCFDCHDSARGEFTAGKNTDCVGCHAKAHGEAASAAQHAAVPDYRFDAARPNFCRDCHADGRLP